jgi:hypothetical protein
MIDSKYGTGGAQMANLVVSEHKLVVVVVKALLHYWNFRKKNKLSRRSYFRFTTVIKASFGSSTFPTIFIRFFPSFCLFSSFIFRLMSPPYCKRFECKRFFQHGSRKYDKQP